MQKIILDVVPNGIEPRVYVNQFDTGRTFQIAFKENFGSYYFPNDVVFRINGRKADNHIFEYSEADKWDATHYVITKSGSGDSLVVTIATTEQMTAAAGETKVQLTFKSSSASNDILGTLNFILVVQEKPDANGDPSESDIPGLVRSVNGVDPDASGNVLLPPAQGAIGAHNIAPVEPTRTMSTARAAGTQVYVTADDQLYDIISPIGSGGTLTPGTNAIASSISSDLADKLDKSGAYFTFYNSAIADVSNTTKFYTDADLQLVAGGTGKGIYACVNDQVYVVTPTHGSYKAITASAFTVGSSRLIKENIKALSDDEAKKILDVETVAFDYKESFGGQRDQYGVIAEDVEKIIPFVVSTPETYDESAFDESKGAGQPLKSVDYSKFVPYLIRMIQIQQAEIDELKKRL